MAFQKQWCLDIDKMKNFLQTQNLKQNFSAEKKKKERKTYFQISTINKCVASEKV